ncbi:hypothetical protein [Nocardia sp. Root136]|uniref:hypothetical protein n=1 Tax=Nocardia sp. Root136 TaxID=1736458 RepID=UPI0012E8EE3C|nr:hypothetical protein [Nocardia sp. Root136]
MMATVAMGGEDIHWSGRRWRDRVVWSANRQVIPPSGSANEPREREPEWENALAASLFAWTAFLGG